MKSMKFILHHAFAISLAALAGSQAFDIASSRGDYEENPILGRGSFGARQISIKMGIVSAVAGAELLFTRHRPESRCAFIWVNLAGAGVTTGAAIHNEVLR